MRHITLIMIALVATSTAVAQRLNNYKEKLLSPVQVDSLTTIWNSVSAKEYGDAAEIVAAERATSNINGYRIITFVSNTPTARQDALAVKEQCDSLFSTERTYLFYENPYFKVSVGNCTSQDEAIILLERVRRTYPKAFTVRTAIPLTELHRKPAPVVTAEPATAEDSVTPAALNEEQRKDIVKDLLRRL